ncbi:MAG: hypothetical protein BMS9Abin26_1509 [Gammaproteobacteria bacterium]|nr:MAG: hypothetical protein BMS9Abin26_1509 [Gammaproteobacteria bacterium]
MLTVLDHLPEELLSVQPEDIMQVLNGPTLINLQGRRDDVLVMSVLLHGNETTGFLALQSLLKKYRQHELPRSVSLLIGNVFAAQQLQRRLEGQPDYNRIWLPGDLPEHSMTREVLEHMRQKKVFAAIDVHNNTGLNPHYACVNRIDHRSIYLASLFSNTLVYFTRPEGVFTSAMADIGPSVVLECGLPGESHGVDHVLEYLQACLHMEHIPTRDIPAQEFHLYHTVATVKVPSGLSFGFGDDPADIRFECDLDHLNFRELPANTTIGRFNIGMNIWLDVQDETGSEVGGRYFCYQDGEILTTVPLMPSMLTLDKRVIRQDCLCYLMESYPLSAHRADTAPDATQGPEMLPKS